MAYTPKQGVFDQGYLDFLNTLSQDDLNARGYSSDPMTRGTSTDYNTLQSIKGALGRDPTATEWAMLGPAGGQAGQLAAQIKYQEDNSPENRAAKQLKDNQSNAPKFYDQISQMFQGTLGRDATQEEKDHFGSMLASGTTDPYTVQQFLTALPESVRKQDEQFRGTLSNTLQKQDSQYYNEQILPAIQAAATKQGRSLDASGVSAMMAKAAQEQNRGREGFMSNLTAAQYAGSQGLAQDAYQKAYGANQGLTDYSRMRSDGLTDALTSRLNSIQDYNMQKQAYDQYLQRYGKRNSGQGQAIGSLAGMGIGALLAAPTGGMSLGAGAMLGGMMGGAGGSFFG